MPKVYISPVAAAEANRNFRQTVIGGGPHRYWGLRESNGCGREWAKAEVGDYIIFKGALQYFVTTRITRKIRDRDLAQKLWGIDQRGYVWEYIFELSEPRPLTASVADYESVLGARISGLQRVLPTRLKAGISQFGRKQFLQSLGIEDSLELGSDD